LNAAPGGDPASGRITAVAADPTDFKTSYIAAAGGGVWKTTDGGSHWTPLTDSQSTLFMGALAVAPSDPNTIYAGTGEADNSGDSYYGRGVLRSTDAGATWKLLGISHFDRRTISKIVVSPTDPKTVYVALAADGTNGVSTSSPGTGIWKSTDGGSTWTNTTTKISTTEEYSDLAMDPLNPQTLYAAVGSYYGTSVNGIYKTTDGGKTWMAAGNAPKGSNNGNTKIALAPTNDQVAYASIADPSTGSLSKMMKSVDGGVTWQQLAATPNYMGAQGWYDSTLAVDPSSPNTVYAAGQDSVLRSLNGGLTWSDITLGFNGHGPHADHHGIGFDADGRLLDGNDGGIWRLDNGIPALWTDLNGNLQITQFTGIALDPTHSQLAYGGSQDNGTERFTGSQAWPLIAGGDGGFVRVDFNNPLRLYHTFADFPEEGAFFQRSEDGGTTWLEKDNGLNLSDPADFYPPYVMDPSNTSRLLLGTDRVYETTNRADSWRPISTPNSKGWVGSDSIDSLAIAPSDGNTIYASAGGRIFVTTDDGTTWREHLISGVSDNIADLVVDPENSQIVYAVRDHFDGGHVYRSLNGGVSWTNISGNLPNLPAYTLVLEGSTLFVGNDDGVYESATSGIWNRLGDALPNVQVRDLALNQTLGILAAGTHGRGMWELSLGSLVTHFSLTASASSVTAGASVQLMVTALNDQDQAVTDYAGTVHFTSTDPSAMLPADYTFTAGDGGTHNFAATLVQSRSQTISVADLAAALNGSATLSVTPAMADHFSLRVATGSTAGTALDLVVTALDPFNNIDVNYQGTVHFTTTDSGSGVVLPADTIFTAADAGVLTLAASVTLVTAGNQEITASDTVSGITGAAGIIVVAAAPDQLQLAAPAQVVSGVAFDVTVVVQDVFNNPVMTYQGTIQFAASDADPGVVLPMGYTFTSADAGVHTFAGGATLITVGQQTLSVDDPSLGITGQALIEVTAPPAPPGGDAHVPGGGPSRQAISLLPTALRLPRPPSPQPVSQPGPAQWPSAIEAANLASFFGAAQVEDRSVWRWATGDGWSEDWSAVALAADDLRSALRSQII
jgi:photosystem II stability/assembly factor-like uncharacterized protein